MSQDGHRIGRGLQRTDLCRTRRLEDAYRSPEDVPGDWRTPTGVQRTCQEIGGRLLESRGRARRLEDVSSSPEDVSGAQGTRGHTLWRPEDIYRGCPGIHV